MMIERDQAERPVGTVSPCRGNGGGLVGSRSGSAPIATLLRPIEREIQSMTTTKIFGALGPVALAATVCMGASGAAHALMIDGGDNGPHLREGNVAGLT